MSEEQPDQTPSEASLFRAILGDGSARPGKANLRMILRALKEGRDIPPEKRRALVEHLVGVVAHEPRHSRTRLVAARCLLAAERADLRVMARPRRATRGRHTAE
jgi:hypothetical protein